MDCIYVEAAVQILISHLNDESVSCEERVNNVILVLEAGKNFLEKINNNA